MECGSKWGGNNLRNLWSLGDRTRNGIFSTIIPSATCDVTTSASQVPQWGIMCSPDIVLFHSPHGGVVLLGPGRPARRYHARTTLAHGQRSCQSGAPGHGMRALQTLGRGSGGKAACVMETCAPEADASWRVGCERTPVDHDGDDKQPHALQRMHLQKLITSPCW